VSAAGEAGEVIVSALARPFAVFDWESAYSRYTYVDICSIALLKASKTWSR
jgi:hypothetical protein